MASFVYNITIKSNSPLTEEDVDDALDLFYNGEGIHVQVTEFDLEDEEYSQV